MKPRIITTAAVMGLLLALSAGDLFAAGRGNGGNSAARSAGFGPISAILARGNTSCSPHTPLWRCLADVIFRFTQGTFLCRSFGA